MARAKKPRKVEETKSEPKDDQLAQRLERFRETGDPGEILGSDDPDGMLFHRTDDDPERRPWQSVWE
jgi:hypothetical protein